MSNTRFDLHIIASPNLPEVNVTSSLIFSSTFVFSLTRSKFGVSSNDASASIITTPPAPDDIPAGCDDVVGTEFIR